MFLERARSRQALSLATDALGILAAFGVAFLVRMWHEQLPLLQRVPSLAWQGEIATRSDYAMLLVTNLTVWLLVMRRSRLYATPALRSLPQLAIAYVKTLAVCVLFTGAVVFGLKILVSRLFFGYFYLSIPVLLLAKEWTLGRLLRRAGSESGQRRRALVIGAGEPATWLARVIEGARDCGYELACVVNTDSKTDGARAAGGERTVRALDVDAAWLAEPADEVFLIGSAAELAQLAPLAQAFIERGRVVSLVTAFRSGRAGVRGRISEFSGIPVLSYGPVPRDEVRSGTRRVMDVLAALAALITLSPVLLAISAAIKLRDGGPALFRQRRLGLGGQPFLLYKFRSMRPDAEQVLQSDPRLHARYLANDFKLKEAEDPRITPLGRWLRRTSLDELPQLWNVLRGDMTLVGPRPICPDEIEHYGAYAELFLAVSPGLTGSWQVNGRSEVRYPERAFLDLDYIGSHSAATDFGILLRTIPAVIRRRGAG